MDNIKNKYIGCILFVFAVVLIVNFAVQSMRKPDKEYLAYQSSIDEVIKNAERVVSEAKASREKASEAFESINQEAEMLVYIADQYYELSQKKDLTDEDVAMLKFYYDYLVSHGVALK